MRRSAPDVPAARVVRLMSDPPLARVLWRAAAKLRGASPQRRSSLYRTCEVILIEA